jgi:hypothetical protein
MYNLQMTGAAQADIVTAQSSFPTERQAFLFD